MPPCTALGPCYGSEWAKSARGGWYPFTMDRGKHNVLKDFDKFQIIYSRVVPPARDDKHEMGTIINFVVLSLLIVP